MDRLSGAHLEHVGRWMKEKGINVCRLCGGKDWGVRPKLGALSAGVPAEGGGTAVGAGGWTFYVASCEGCGNTLLLSTTVVGMP